MDDPAKPAKPTHYKVICISMYTRDIEQLDAKVAEFKRRGWTKANKSAVIRLALERLDVQAVEMVASDAEIRAILERGGQ